MSITEHVQLRYVGDEGKATPCWLCDTLICSDLRDELRSINPMCLNDTDIIDIAAQHVDLVRGFEEESGFIDFDLKTGKSIKEKVQARVELDLTPAPLAVISLAPTKEGRVSHEA